MKDQGLHLETFEYHRFLDEAGDTTFYGKGKLPILGKEGVSLSFTLGMTRFQEPLPQLRAKIIQLQKSIESNLLFNSMESVKKRIQKEVFIFTQRMTQMISKKYFLISY